MRIATGGAGVPTTHSRNTRGTGTRRTPRSRAQIPRTWISKRSTRRVGEVGLRSSPFRRFSFCRGVLFVPQLPVHRRQIRLRSLWRARCPLLRRARCPPVPVRVRHGRPAAPPARGAAVRPLASHARADVVEHARERRSMDTIRPALWTEFHFGNGRRHQGPRTLSKGRAVRERFRGIKVEGWKPEGIDEVRSFRVAREVYARGPRIAWRFRFCRCGDRNVGKRGERRGTPVRTKRAVPPPLTPSLRSRSALSGPEP